MNFVTRNDDNSMNMTIPLNKSLDTGGPEQSVFIHNITMFVSNDGSSADGNLMIEFTAPSHIEYDTRFVDELCFDDVLLDNIIQELIACGIPKDIAYDVDITELGAQDDELIAFDSCGIGEWIRSIANE